MSVYTPIADKVATRWVRNSGLESEFSKQIESGQLCVFAPGMIANPKMSPSAAASLRVYNGSCAVAGHS